MDELFTLEDLAAFRGAGSYTPADEIAARDTATGLVRGFCGWHVAPEVTETVSWVLTDSAYLFVATLRLASKPTVTLADLSTPTDFSWATFGMLSRDAGWGEADDVVTGRITHGYPEGSFQHKLVRGVALGVAARILLAGSDPTTAALLDSEERQLHPYRLLP